MNISLCLIAALAVVTLILARGSACKQSAIKTTRDSARDAIELIRQWSTWMAGIQAGILTSLGVLTKDGLSDRTLCSAELTVLFMGSSLFATAWILSALPILRLNLDPRSGAHDENDIYEQTLYRSLPITLGMVSFWQHLLWVLAILCFSVFLCFRFTDPSPHTASQKIEVKPLLQSHGS